VAAVAAMQAQWETLRPLIDPERHSAVAAKLARQRVEAGWWRDSSIAYFQTVSGLPLPPNERAPAHSLSWYQAIHFDTVPGFLGPWTGRQMSCVPPEGGPPCAL